VSCLEQPITSHDDKRTTNNETDNPFPEPVELEITDTLDLHAFSPKDVKAVTIAYLEEAHKKGFSIVRIIHGKGIGVQREIVRSALRDSDLVEGFRSGDEFSGGAGSTVVTFRR
jgi:dsDNA-specific endonuclease/ATPase MutS2